MSINKVFYGIPVSLGEILDAREKRQKFQYELMTQYPEYSLLSITLNIPGEIKNSKFLVNFFNTEVNIILDLFKNIIIQKVILNKSTGNEAYIILKIDPLVLKKKLIEFEESNKKRRILDLDVLFLKNEMVNVVSRKDFNLPSRKCIICEENAKKCGRSRKHTVEEMQEKISKLINS